MKIQNVMLTLSYNEIELLMRAFKTMLKFPGEKFSYFVSKNINILNSKLKEVDAYYKSVAPEQTDRVKDFSKKETELFESFCTKLPNGKLKLIDGYRYDIPETKKEELDAEKEILYKEYEDVLEIFNASEEAVKEFKEKKIEVEFFSINRSDLPGMITAENRLPIEDLINDDIDGDIMPLRKIQ
jgi:hypothetical protein